MKMKQKPKSILFVPGFSVGEQVARINPSYKTKQMVNKWIVSGTLEIERNR